MLPLGHVIASCIISSLVWIFFKSFACAAVSFASGILIDKDHLIDYYISHGFTLKARAVYDSCLHMRLKRLYLIFHSYELIAIFWAAIYVFSLSNIWKAAAIGFTQHLIIDQFTNPIKRPGYLLAYRIVNGFKTDSIVKR